MKEKGEVLAGLVACGMHMTCAECPYEREPECVNALLRDAVKLMEADVQKNEKKVLKGLKICAKSETEGCRGCPYYNCNSSCTETLARDAGELLAKKLEAKK